MLRSVYHLFLCFQCDVSNIESLLVLWTNYASRYVLLLLLFLSLTHARVFVELSRTCSHFRGKKNSYLSLERTSVSFVTISTFRTRCCPRSLILLKQGVSSRYRGAEEARTSNALCIHVSSKPTHTYIYKHMPTRKLSR